MTSGKAMQSELREKLAILTRGRYKQYEEDDLVQLINSEVLQCLDRLENQSLLHEVGATRGVPLRAIEKERSRYAK